MILEVNRFVDPLIKLLGDKFIWLSEITIGSIIIRLLLVTILVECFPIMIATTLSILVDVSISLKFIFICSLVYLHSPSIWILLHI